jgi:hypothetical protein
MTEKTYVTVNAKRGPVDSPNRIYRRFKVQNPSNGPDSITVEGHIAHFDAYLDMPDSQIIKLFVKTLTGRRINVECKRDDSVDTVKGIIEAKEGHPPLSQRLIIAPGEELKDGWSLRRECVIVPFYSNILNTLQDYKLDNESIVHLVLSFRNRADTSPLGQCSVEDRFSRTTNEDPLLPIAYDFRRGRRLNVTIIDAARFSLGVKPPVEIPKDVRVDNESLFPQSVDLPGPDILQTAGDTSVLNVYCASCSYELPTTRLEPCNHNICKRCFVSQAHGRCPSCQYPIQGHERLLANINCLGREGECKLEAGSLDDRLAKLRQNASRGTVVSFILRSHAVSPLHGAQKEGSGST